MAQEMGEAPDGDLSDAQYIELLSAERDRLRGERDTLWDRAHDRGVAIEHARNRLHALADQHDGVRGELLAIADALWASMQDAVPADARGEKALTAAGSCPLLGTCGYEDEDGNWTGHGIWRDRAACQEECRKLVPADARSKVMYDVQMTADEAAEIDARRDARGEVDRLREALRFYAEGRHFEVDDPPQEENNIYLLEHGEHARAALAAVPADARDKGEKR